MKIIFLAHYFNPHIGGVENHVYNVAKSLESFGDSVQIITERYDIKLKPKEVKDGIEIIRFSYPKIKYIGIIGVWYWLFKNRMLIKNADVIHCHDVFIWYLPFRFLYPDKNVYTTFHGLEWNDPFRRGSIFQKKLAAKLSMGIVGIGKFLCKYLNIDFDKTSYGGANAPIKKGVKKKGLVVYVGRLEENTGVLKFLDWFKTQRGLNIEFCGDGPLRAECQKYGKVYGYGDSSNFLKKAEICVPGGYLTALEALVNGCKLKLFWHNKLREDIWKMSPFYQLKGKKLYAWAREQTWEKLANEYLDLYHNS